MLEAFVFDPLITWRLLPAHAKAQERAPHTAGAAGAVGAPAADAATSSTAPAAPGAQAAPSAPGTGDGAEGRDDGPPDRPQEPLHERVEADYRAQIGGDPHLASVVDKQARNRELRQHLGPEGVHADPELLHAMAQTV